ncbi:MAG: S-layer homology domain-containing protein [Anaerovoracaceae bacterium]
MKSTRRRKSLPLIIALMTVLVLTPCTTAFAADSSTDSDTVEYPSYTHMAYKGDDSSPYGTGNLLFTNVKITGTAMSEEQIYNVYELEEVYNEPALGLASSMNDTNGLTLQGLDLYSFLTMCGIDMTASDVSLTFYSRNSEDPVLTVPVTDVVQGNAIIAVAEGEKPLVTSESSDGYDADAKNSGGPLKIYIEGSDPVENVSGIRVSLAGQTEDPHYGYHNRDPLTYMESTIFTVNYIDSSKYEETDDNAMPFRTLTFTMQQLEQFASDNPDHVAGNYFGIAGNEEDKDTLGLAGFHDYFEGLDMSWFLTEKTGLKNTGGWAAFYGRDNDYYAEVKDLSYFFSGGDYSDYYLEEDYDTLVTGVVPTLAFSKNGAPLLPRHDHEMEGYIDYNTFTYNAEKLGVITKVGIVKNVSGPFVAGLPNLDGVYGGYRNETSGDCIRIDIYTDRTQYSGLSTYFTDVLSDSWFAEPVNYLASRGALSGNGDGTFNPDGRVTRAEYVTMIASAEGADTSEYSQSSFNDVDSDSWAMPYIEWAADNGIVSGMGDGNFDPDASITRQDIAVISERYLEYKNVTVTEKKDISVFSDSSSISEYARDSVENMYSRGIMQGIGENTFSPLTDASRAEAATVTSGILQAITSAAQTE